MLHVSSEQFNFYEGLFWVGLGIVVLCLYKKVPKQYRTLALVASVVLVTFGISDFMQVLYGSFMVPGMQWLYLWKAIDLTGLVLVVGWYLYLRIAKS